MTDTNSMSLTFLLESLLFVSQHPLSARKLAALTSKPLAEVRFALSELLQRYTPQQSGIVLLQNNDEYQFATHPDASPLIQTFLNEEVMGELTRPALETLSVIAYRGPVLKSEIEKIRGVNCSLALRNLLLRGLVEESEDKTASEKSYTLSMIFLRHLGVQDAQQLPDFERLHSENVLPEEKKQEE